MAQPTDADKSAWTRDRLTRALTDVGRLRGGRNTLLYGSAFLQKPGAPFNALAMTAEDINGFMTTIHNMDWPKGLTLLLHTPGGDPNAVETIVAYLRSKFADIEVIVPAYAMSAGTMLSLGADRIVMGRQSQLGPIDPQLQIGGRAVSGPAIVEQFEEARLEILGDGTRPGNLDAAHLWAPITQSLGPALLREARNAIDHGEAMVASWLETYMFRRRKDRVARARSVAHFFSDASMHKSHGRRIGRTEARAKGLRVTDLERSQDLQEQVLTAYHLMTISFEQSLASKMMWSNAGSQWIKSTQPV